jgi:hypothetical protein
MHGIVELTMQDKSHAFKVKNGIDNIPEKAKSMTHH